MKAFRFLFLLVIAALAFSAQFKVVSDVKELTGDITAQKYGHKDVNGDWCAIVKVHSDIEGILFEGMGYEKHDYKGEGIYLVYMQPESKTLKFKKEDFVAYNHTFPFKLNSNTVYQMEVVSEGEEKKIEDIAVNLIGQPEGVLVSVDGLDKGVVKQFMTSVGKHEIVVSKEGFQPEKLEIEVSPENTMFNYKLEKLRDAVFEVTSEPTGATVFLNGVKLGETPLTELYPIGTYKLKLECENCETLEKDIEIRLPVTKESFKLEYIGATLTINTQEKATVTINGKKISSFKNIKLSPQVANIKVEIRGAPAIEKRLILGKKDNQTVDMYPEIKTGTVQVTVKPDDASVEMKDESGINYSSVGSKIFTDVPTGEYGLKVHREGYKTQRSEVKLTEGAVEKHSFKLEEGYDDPNKKDPWGPGMFINFETGHPISRNFENYKDTLDIYLNMPMSIGYGFKYDIKLNKRIYLTCNVKALFFIKGEEPADSTLYFVNHFGLASANGGVKVNIPFGFHVFGEAGITRINYKFSSLETDENHQYDGLDFNYALGLGYTYKRLDLSTYFNAVQTDYENFYYMSLTLGFKTWVY